MGESERLQLSGFNNLTKSLSFNMYDVCYEATAEDRAAYLAYIDEEYSAPRLTRILTECVHIIGANILNIAKQDYEPSGASVTLLISEGPVSNPDPTCVVAHLDKSHICVHTYPEEHPDAGIATFRADIEVSTCGTISPLRALNYLIDCFDADVLNLDYRVRGFTRDIKGHKPWIDHGSRSIQEFIDPQLLSGYYAKDMNVEMERLWHTKLMWKDIDLDRYTFGSRTADARFDAQEQRTIKERLQHEIREIYYGSDLSI
jgi:S-adenosylmethionine decarboxylase